MVVGLEGERPAGGPSSMSLPRRVGAYPLSEDLQHKGVTAEPTNRPTHKTAQDNEP